MKKYDTHYIFDTNYLRKYLKVVLYVFKTHKKLDEAEVVEHVPSHLNTEFRANIASMLGT